MGGLSREQQKMKPLGNAFRAAALAFSAFFMTSCALPAANIPKPVMPQRSTIQKTAGDAPVFSSSWERGSCNFKQNALTFSDGKGNEATIPLDVKVKGPRKLMCSADHSVIITLDKAVISLGGDAMLEGREWLGSIGRQFTLVNSYELSLEDFPVANGRTESLHGNTLVVQSQGRKAWSIDLVDPYTGWNHY